MGSPQQIQEIYQYLQNADQRLISLVYSMIKSDKESNDIVGHRANGEPLTKFQLISDVLEAEREIERGNFLSIDDLEKESENW